jgi:hypothetical protein
MKHSSYAPSFDDDYFPKKDASRNLGLWKWLLLIGFCLFFVYRSTLPVMHLRSEPPAEFISPNPSGSHQPALPARRTAQTYWKVAVRSIQPKYAAGKPLPADPPPEFTINTKTADLAGDLNFERAYYWQRLRDTWQQPEAWRASYGWNTEWFDRSVATVQQYLSESLRQFVQSVRFWRGEVGNTSIP